MYNIENSTDTHTHTQSYHFFIVYHVLSTLETSWFPILITTENKFSHYTDVVSKFQRVYITFPSSYNY